MDIIEQFLKERNNYNEFSERLNQLIISILQSHEIKPHQISVRVKEFDSLKKKIENKENQYSDLSEITDIVGIRIITYFEDEVDLIADIIKREFDLDDKNSIDKRKSEVDKFGYKSLHYIISLSAKRNKLSEYSKYKNLKAEIQIRSILQHSWAEIEHDLGYKSKSSIPDFAKRNFSRISALLEVADIEFVNLKNQLTNYKKEIKTQIKSTPEIVTINQDSLKEFVETNKLFSKVQEQISIENNININENWGELHIAIETFELYGINTIGDLEKKLKEYSKKIIEFEKIGFSGYSSYGKAGALYSLAEILLLENQNRVFFEENFNEFLNFDELLVVLDKIEK